MSAPGALKQRIESFDWLRGVAVLFMIQCHTIMFLLDPALKGSWLYKVLLKLDGLVAPSFIFSAGFSLALVQVRGSADPLKRGRKTLRRLLEVLAIATFVNWMWFPIFREAKWWTRIDILHCIGFSLLAALPLMVALAKRPVVLRWVTLGLGCAVLVVTPHLPDPSGWPSGSPFPLLPWAGYVYLGASAGATAAGGDLRALVRWILLLLGLGLVGWLALGLNHPQRVVWVMGFVLVFLALEYRLTAVTRTLPFKIVTVLGTSSLAAYCLHEAMLFYGTWWALALGLLVALVVVRGKRPALAVVPLALGPVLAYQMAWRFHGLAWADFFRDRASWAQYWPLLLVLLAATYGLVVVTDAVYRRLDALLQPAKA